MESSFIRAINALTPHLGRQGVAELIDALRWASMGLDDGLRGVSRATYKLSKPGTAFRAWQYNEGGHWSEPWGSTCLGLNGTIVLVLQHENDYRPATLVADIEAAQAAWEAHKAFRRAAGQARSERNARILEAIASGYGDHVAIAPGSAFDGDVAVSIEGFENFGALVGPARGSSLLRALEARGAISLSDKEREIVASPEDWRRPTHSRHAVILGALQRALAEGKALRDPAPLPARRSRRAGNIEWELAAY